MRFSLRYLALTVLAMALVSSTSASHLHQNLEASDLLTVRALPSTARQEIYVRMSPGSAHSGDRDSPSREQQRKGKSIVGRLKRLTLGKGEQKKDKGVSASYSSRSASPVRDTSPVRTPTASPSPEWEPPNIRDPDTPDPSPPHPVGPFPEGYHGPPRPQSKGKKILNAVKKFW